MTSEEEQAFDRVFEARKKEGITCSKIPPPHITIEEKKPELPDKLIEINNAIIASNSILKRIFESQKKRTNYHISYYIDTSNTTRRKIDLSNDMGIPASELTVLSIGGGFDIEINDEPKYTPAANFQVTDESIDYVYVTGNGAAGSARIRFGTWR